MQVPERITFSGQLGHTRQGTIIKTWNDPDGRQWAHVQADPIYIWEKPGDCVFVVCLDPNYLDHKYCIAHREE